MIRYSGWLILAWLALSGCGGGGSAPPPQPTPTISFPSTTFTFTAASPTAAIPADQTVTATVANVTAGTLYIVIAPGDANIATVSNFQVTGSSSGQATLSVGYPAALGMGTHTTTFTVTACLNDSTCKTGVLAGSPATITVNYDIGSPVQTDTLMPAVVTSNTPGKVILRGSGFTAVTGILFGTTAGSAVTVVNDSEIDATYPALSAGSLTVTLQTGSANTAFGAGLTVVDPPTFTAATLTVPAVTGTQFSVASLAYDAVNGALLVGMTTLDTALPPNFTPANNVILRYPCAAGTWSTPTVTPWPNLRKTALSPDSKTLLAATDGAIDSLNSVTLVSAGSSAKPAVTGEYIAGLAYTNDGNVVVTTGYANGTGSTALYLYSLHDGSYSLPLLSGTGPSASNSFYYADVAASGDGSVAVIPQESSNTPVERYLASTGQWVASATLFDYATPGDDWPASGVAIDEHADLVLLQNSTEAVGPPNVLALNATTLQQIGIVASGSEALLISPDGSRAYVLSITQTTPATCSVRSFDLTMLPSAPTGSYNEITTGGYPVARPCLSDINSPSVGALSIDGKTLFVAGGTAISVIPLP